MSKNTDIRHQIVQEIAHPTSKGLSERSHRPKTNLATVQMTMKTLKTTKAMGPGSVLLLRSGTKDIETILLAFITSMISVERRYPRCCGFGFPTISPLKQYKLSSPKKLELIHEELAL